MFDRIKKLILKPKTFWIILALVYVVSRLATWFYPFDSDHWIFYYVGNNWFHGGSLYLTAWDHKPPLIFLFNGLLSLIFGGNIIWHRIFFTLLSFVDIYLFYRLLWVIAPKLKVKLTALFINSGLLLYVFWRNLSQFTSSGNNTENFGLTFFLGMILSYISFRDDRKWWKLLISGVCFSILFFLKGNFILLGVPIGILMLLDYYKDIKRLFLYSFLFVLPLFAQASFWLLHFWKQQTLYDFFVASFLFSSKYSKSAWSGNLSNNIVLLLTLVVFLVPVLLLFGIMITRLKKNKNNLIYLLIIMFFFSGLLLTLGVGSFYPYYFVISMPIFVIVMVYGLFNISDMNKYFRYFIYLILVGSTIISLGISMKQLLNSFGGNAKVEANEYAIVAEYVKNNTSSSDKVFDYDYGATFYQLAERDSGSRYISASVLLLDYRDNYGFNLNEKFIADMENSKAKYVVVYKDKDNLYYQNKPIVDYFNEHYYLEKSFDKFEVLRRN